jgi:putative NIF3 family GTP cyclohydrolase 1 type 2
MKMSPGVKHLASHGVELHTAHTNFDNQSALGSIIFRLGAAEVALQSIRCWNGERKVQELNYFSFTSCFPHLLKNNN